MDRQTGAREVTCLTNPLKTPPKDTVHVQTLVQTCKRSDAESCEYRKAGRHRKGNFATTRSPFRWKKQEVHLEKALNLSFTVQMQKMQNGKQLHATGEAERPDGLSKYHCKYWQLCPVPCLTPLIHLPLPRFFPIPSLFQSMLIFLLDSAAPPPPSHPPFSSPSASSSPRAPSLKSDPDGQMSPFQTTSVSLDSRVCPVFFFFFKGAGQWDINRHKGPDAGGRDRSFPLQTEKKGPASPTNGGQRQLCLQPLETTDQPQIEILIKDIFSSRRQCNTQSYACCLKICRNFTVMAKCMWISAPGSYLRKFKNRHESIPLTSHQWRVWRTHPLPHMPQGHTCVYFCKVWNVRPSGRRHECVTKVYSLPMRYPKDLNSSL